MGSDPTGSGRIIQPPAAGAAVADRLRLWSVVIVVAATLAGAVLRGHTLGANSFDPAEVTEVNAADAIRFRREPVGDPIPGVAAWVAAGTLHWGYGEATLRRPIAFAGTLTILVVWALGLLACGSEAATYAAVALALAPLHVGISRRVGPDVWLTLCATLTVVTCLWAARAPQAWRRQALCGVLAMLTCACAYRGVLVIAAIAVAAVVLAIRDPLMRHWATRCILLMFLAAAVAGMAAAYAQPRWYAGILRPPIDGRFPFDLLSQLATHQPQQWSAGIALAVCATVGLASIGRSRAGTFLGSWLLVGGTGLLGTDWLRHAAFQPEAISFVLPAYVLLGAAGLTWLRRTVCVGNRAVTAIGQVAACTLLLALGLPGLRELPRQPSWRDAAHVVAANLRPDDVLVVLAEQPSFTFYAPDLVRRMEPDVRPAWASGYFARRKRGWLVVPAQVRNRPGWAVMQRWLDRFPPVDLSPDDRTVVLYMGQGGHDDLVVESAYFPLPTATLVHGRVLLDWLLQVGPVPAVLWKVDQIALSREAVDVRNPALLQAVYYLAQHDHGDRAASLAYRLATAEPHWEEAQRALEAFRRTD